MSTARDEQIEAAAEEIYDAVQAAVPHSIPGHRAIEAILRKHFADVELPMVGGIRCRLLAKYRGGIYICDDETTQLALTLDGRWVHREQGHVFDGLDEARAHIAAHANQGDKSAIGRGKK